MHSFSAALSSFQPAVTESRPADDPALAANDERHLAECCLDGRRVHRHHARGPKGRSALSAGLAFAISLCDFMVVTVAAGISRQEPI